MLDNPKKKKFNSAPYRIYLAEKKKAYSEGLFGIILIPSYWLSWKIEFIYKPIRITLGILIAVLCTILGFTLYGLLDKANKSFGGILTIILGIPFLLYLSYWVLFGIAIMMVTIKSLKKSRQ